MRPLWNLAAGRRHLRAGEGAEFPYAPSLVVAQDVEVAIVRFDLEVAVLRREPPVNQLGHLDTPYIERWAVELGVREAWHALLDEAQTS